MFHETTDFVLQNYQDYKTQRKTKWFHIEGTRGLNGTCDPPLNPSATKHVTGVTDTHLMCFVYSTVGSRPYWY